MSAPKPISLPFPPSVNAIWRSVKGRNIKSKPYRDWQAEAGTLLAMQRPEKHEGPVEVSILLCPPDARRRDIDNAPKAILDLLVQHQVIQRDDMAFVRKLTVAVGTDFKGAQVTVSPAPDDAELLAGLGGRAA